MQFIQFQLADFTTGAAIPFGKCTVYLAGTSTLAALFDSGGGSIPNPVTASSVAQVGFAAADGLYDFQPSYSNGSPAGPKILSQRLADYSASTGASGIGWLASWVGAVIRTVAAKLSDTPSVKDFGAKGDANSTGSTGTDDTAAIQAALNYVSSVGGDKLFFPRGNYKVTSYLTVPNFTTLIGAGRRATKIVGTHAGGGGANAAENLRNGSIFYNAATINSTTAVHIAFENLYITNVNAANVGAGLYQQAGDGVYARNCTFQAKYGVVLDQSEDVKLDYSDLSSNIAGGGGLWIVNGPDLVAGAATEFANIISVRDCHVNVIAGSYGIIDDGGDCHTFDGCDFNAGINAIRAASVNCLTISNSYAESQTSEIISLNNTSLSGRASGGSLTLIQNGIFAATAGNSTVKGHGSPGSLTIIGGDYIGGGGTAPLTGVANFARVTLAAYNNGSASTAFTDGTTTGLGSGWYVDLNAINVSPAGIGYAPGSGGTVTQLTNKATAVTLNKACGVITMNAAALAAGAVVSFTLSNALIAADDELTVRLRSGYATAGTYRAWAEGNAPGSRTICVQNISAGPLSEAVVLGFILLKGASS